MGEVRNRNLTMRISVEEHGRLSAVAAHLKIGEAELIRRGVNFMMRSEGRPNVFRERDEKEAPNGSRA